MKREREQNTVVSARKVMVSHWLYYNYLTHIAN